MTKRIITIAFAAICSLFLSGCEDDFPTVLNMEYAEPDTPTDPGDEPTVGENAMKLGSYNLWISNKGTGEYVWSNRRSALTQSILNNKFDIFGFQEANATIQNELPQLVEMAGGHYEWWFIGRDTQDGMSGEAIGIAYNPDRFELSDKHFFWLSETPDVVSYGWEETGYHRIAACAMVHDKTYKKQFFMMVTHGPLNDNARAKAAELLIEREQMYNPEGIPSILVGDMNAAPTDAASVTFRTHWEDSRDVVPTAYVFGPVGTFQGHNTAADLSKESARIDYIYVRGELEAASYRVDNAILNNIYPSDHCPVNVTLTINYTPDNVEGSGTQADPYQINTVSDWNRIGGAINSSADTYPVDGFYRIMNDIDFTDKTLVAWDKFNGTLDGGGFTLKNISAANTEESTFGLICTNNGTVKDIAVEAMLSSVYKNFGGVVGTNAGVIDGATFKGTLTGTVAASYIGGIAGLNTGTVVNCANLGGNIAATNATKAENCGGVVGGVTTGHYVINCYSHIDRIESSNNNIGGIVGFVGNDSFVINCYSTLATITAGGTYCSAVGYNKVGNIQNIYGNADCQTSKAGAVIANDKKAGTVWPTSTGLLLTLEQMQSGAVTVPSSGEACADFTAALNAGVKIFNETTTATLATKPDVTLRAWKASATYPTLN